MLGPVSKVELAPTQQRAGVTRASYSLLPQKGQAGTSMQPAPCPLATHPGQELPPL